MENECSRGGLGSNLRMFEREIVRLLSATLTVPESKRLHRNALTSGSVCGAVVGLKSICHAKFQVLRVSVIAILCDESVT